MKGNIIHMCNVYPSTMVCITITITLITIVMVTCSPMLSLITHVVTRSVGCCDIWKLNLKSRPNYIINANVFANITCNITMLLWNLSHYMVFGFVGLGWQQTIFIYFQCLYFRNIKNVFGLCLTEKSRLQLQI